MTDNSSTTPVNPSRQLLIWLLCPIAIFPLLALLTYDWRSIDELCTPAAPHTNWIGALGDYFAYYGYTLFGLAIWIVPLLAIFAVALALRGKRWKLGCRELWFVVFIAATSGLLQTIGSHGGIIGAITQRLNLGNAGGAVGYLLMTRFLSPLVSDFASSVLVIVVMAVSIVIAIGVGNLRAAIGAVAHWAMCGRDNAATESTNDDPFGMTPSEDPQQAAFLAAIQARDEAKAEARAEKERIKEEKRLEKERLKEEKRLAKEAAKVQSAQPKNNAIAVNGDAGDTNDENDKGPYLLPPLSLLNPLKRTAADHGDVDEMSRRLIDTLKLFGVDAAMSFTVQGPVVTKYAFKVAPGIRYSAVTNLQDNLMGSLHAKSLRIEAPIPGKEEIGIEVPNRSPAGISFREIIESEAWKNFKGELPLLFGKDASGKELIADLATMPHMLVAGATGQGKSVCLNSLINGLLMTRTPEQLKLIMVDPKSVEFSNYASIPHLIVPVITENRKVVFSLQWATVEMEKRLKLFARAKVKNIYDFNHRPSFTQTDMFGDDTKVGSDMPRTIPYIVIIIDEVADLMASSSKEVTPFIARLTAKARAAGIHLILATQRPDAKIITGTIKANIPGRVAFKTATAVDSRTILDDGGAENLIGRGDMLFKSKDGLLIRAQGAWISDPEILNVTRYIEEHSNTQFDARFTDKLSTIKDDEIDLYGENSKSDEGGDAAATPSREQVKAEENASDFKKAIECLINTNRASISHFQRQLGWGYNHSARIMDMLEEAHVIGPQVGAGPRAIIMDQQQLLAIFNGNGDNAETNNEEVTDDSNGINPEIDA